MVSPQNRTDSVLLNRQIRACQALTPEDGKYPTPNPDMPGCFSVGSWGLGVGSYARTSGRLQWSQNLLDGSFSARQNLQSARRAGFPALFGAGRLSLPSWTPSSRSTSTSSD